VENLSNNRARFHAMAESNHDEWQLIGGELERFARRLPDGLSRISSCFAATMAGSRSIDWSIACRPRPAPIRPVGTKNTSSAHYCTISAIRLVLTITRMSRPPSSSLLFRKRTTGWWRITPSSKDTISFTFLGSIGICARNSAGIRISSGPRNSAACSIKSRLIPISCRCRSGLLSRCFKSGSASPANRSMSPRRHRHRQPALTGGVMIAKPEVCVFCARQQIVPTTSRA
jgi:hypothetical protein